jgi:hypothetical protein
VDKQLKPVNPGRDIWIRALYMLLFIIIYSFTEVVIALVAIGQFLTVVLTGSKNDRLLKFGQSLSSFVYQIMQFFTFNSEEKPFPFAEWPEK